MSEFVDCTVTVALLKNFEGGICFWNKFHSKSLTEQAFQNIVTLQKLFSFRHRVACATAPQASLSDITR